MNKNKSRYVKQFLGAAIAAVIASPALAQVSFDANIELDTDMVDTQTADTTYDQNGRVEVNAFGRHEQGAYFVQGRGTVLLKKDGDTGVDDAWVQFGTQSWDLQAGRFEGVNLFPKAKDTLVIHAGGVSVYEANLARGRVGDGGGQLALHYNAASSLKFELGTVFGDPEVDGDNTKAFAGVRPTLTWSNGDFSVTAGYENVSYDLTNGDEVEKEGAALTTSFKVGPAAINLAVAHMENDSTGVDQAITSYVANMVYDRFGAGLIYSEDEQSGVDSDVTTAYLAYTVPLFDFDNASVTFAGSFSKADGASVTDDSTNALRMRFNYTF